MPVVQQSIVIGSSADSVWQAIRDFHDISWAPGVLIKCVEVGDRRGDQIGARRILNDEFLETLLALDDLDRSIKYRLEDGPSPVSPLEVRDFVAVVQVHPVTDADHAFVEWTASWEAADETACNFASSIYAALLAALKTTLEQ